MTEKLLRTHVLEFGRGHWAGVRKRRLGFGFCFGLGLDLVIFRSCQT